MSVYCQNCGKDTADKPLTFYGNVICSEACKKQLSERVYFRDTPPDAGSTWYCPHCGSQNPLGDPRKDLRPSCTSCGKPLDPASAAPPKKGGCLGVLLVVLLPLGLLLLARSTALAAAPVADPVAVPAAGRPPQDAGGRARRTRGEDPRAPRGEAPAPGEVVAVGPLDAEPRHGAFLHGAKYEPPYGRVLHGMGQWREGNAGYVRSLADPALAPATQLYFLPVGDWPRPWDGRVEVFADLLREAVEAGRVPSVDISLYGLAADRRSRQAVDRAIAEGDRYDGRLRDVIAAVGAVQGPVYVRIGGEFSLSTNGYEPFAYPQAFRKIVGMFRDAGVDNAAFVWCYEPSSDPDFADRGDDGAWRWYPGDDVVDWFGLDLFDASQFSGSSGRRGVLSQAGRTERFLQMALDHDKPVMLAELSAARVHITPDPADGRRDWAAFFEPLFAFLDANPNIMAINYISVDWATTGEYAQLGWKDARIDRNPHVAEAWRARIAEPRFLHAGELHVLNGWRPFAPPPPAPERQGASSAGGRGGLR